MFFLFTTIVVVPAMVGGSSVTDGKMDSRKPLQDNGDSQKDGGRQCNVQQWVQNLGSQPDLDVRCQVEFEAEGFFDAGYL